MSKLHSRMKGAAAVELALVSIPMVFIAVAGIDYARAMFVYDQLDKAVRDGARYLTYFNPTYQQDYPIAAAKSRMLYGSTSGSGSTIVPDFDASMITICDRVDSSACPGETFANVPAGASGTVNLVKVTISGYVFTPIFPGISRLTTMTFDPISVTMRQI